MYIAYLVAQLKFMLTNADPSEAVKHPKVARNIKQGGKGRDKRSIEGKGARHLFSTYLVNYQMILKYWIDTFWVMSLCPLSLFHLKTVNFYAGFLQY